MRGATLEQLEALCAALRQNEPDADQLVQTLDGIVERDQQMLRALLDHIPVQMAYLDRDFTILYVNRAYMEGCGLSRQELVGQDHFALFPDKENEAIFRQARDTAKPVGFEAKPFVFDHAPERGTTYWDWTLTPMVDERGQVEGLILSLQDVTAHHTVDMALQHSMQRLSALNEMGRAILAAHSVSAVATIASDYAQHMTGCLRCSVAILHRSDQTIELIAATGAQPQGIQLGRFPWDWAWALPALERGDPVVVQNLGKDGTVPVTPLSVALIELGARGYVTLPIHNAGELIGMLNLAFSKPQVPNPATIETVSQVVAILAIGIHQARLDARIAHQVETLEAQVERRTRALRLSEERFRAAFDEGPLGMAVVDRQGRITISNKALQQILGYSQDELGGIPFDDLTYAEGHAPDTGSLIALTQGRLDSYQVEKRLVNRDGRSAWVNLTVSRVRHVTSWLNYAIIMVEDITQRKEATEALVQAEKMALTGRLAATMAHEINNPLQAVIGCLGLAQEMLANGGDPARYLDVAHGEVKRAASIVTRLRSMHQPSTPADREACDINALLEDVLVISEKQRRDHAIQLAWHPISTSSQLMAVPDRLRQVFLNLVLNALDAMEDGGTLTLRAEQTVDPAGIRVIVEDNGIGIAAQTLDHIFEPFRSDKPEGLGLGLYVSRNIVQEHQGTIMATSQPGQGTTITVWLPRHPTETAATGEKA